MCIRDRCVDMLATSSQQSESSDLDQVLRRANALARDEVHHSVWCLLNVPHHARLSRLCRRRPRPCSRRLPVKGAVFFFSSNFLTCVFVRIGRYQNLNNFTYGNGWFKSRLHSIRKRSREFKSRRAFPPPFFFLLPYLFLNSFC